MAMIDRIAKSTYEFDHDLFFFFFFFFFFFLSFDHDQYLASFLFFSIFYYAPLLHTSQLRAWHREAYI